VSKIEQAIQYAMEKHSGQLRKGKQKPYILHPLEAGAIVARYTEDDDVICAAFLHDVMEDAGVTAQELTEQFGERVAELVASVSENMKEGYSPNDSWRDRKTRTIQGLREGSREVKLIGLGDKLSNLREIASDYAEIGETLWKRFNCKSKYLQEWYYEAVYSVFLREFGNTQEVQEFGMLLTRTFG